MENKNVPETMNQAPREADQMARRRDVVTATCRTHECTPERHVQTVYSLTIKTGH